MEIWAYYLIALIPMVVGAFLYFKYNEITWWEWIVSSIAGFILSGIFHLIAYYGMTSDTETWSGKITHVIKIPRWEEYYETAVYTTEYYCDSRGNTQSRQVFSHWQSHTRWHDETITAYSDLDTQYNINETTFIHFKTVFNDFSPKLVHRSTFNHASRMIDGDPYDYYIYNRTGWIQPVTKSVKFENKIKASKTVFSFITVPTNVSVYTYPLNTDPFESSRLVGTARVLFNPLEFDRLNTILGPLKKINIILVGFGNKDQMHAEYQKSKWLGGKKNDLVICFGGGTKTTPATWATTFGWTESELVKQRLNTLFLDNPINDSLLQKMQDIIIKDYKIRDWSKFDYITIIPNPIYFWALIFFMIISQTILLVLFFNNDSKKL